MSANHSADDSQRIFFDDEHDKAAEPGHEHEAKDRFDPHAASPEEREVEGSYGWGV